MLLVVDFLVPVLIPDQTKSPNSEQTELYTIFQEFPDFERIEGTVAITPPILPANLLLQQMLPEYYEEHFYLV